MKTLGIIPARFASTRFPGKPLALLNEKPLIQWVWEHASQSNSLDEVIVATDDPRIAECVTAFGGIVHMTRPDHLSGTDRCAEVVANYHPGTWTWALNIQGDEPFLTPNAIDQLIEVLKASPAPDIATLARPVVHTAQLFNPNVVKVVRAENGRALYFSRHPVPFFRDRDQEDWLSGFPYLQHIGLYGFRAEVLRQLTELPPSSLELAESLEQLRWLENGYSIAVALTDYESIGIDTPEDLAFAQQIMDR
ncbi:MAG: 3-deoxy-manno-octulosonate cytidylyltransferase [Saprospirales bacterium]|nr:3-deoxy-manno-octulosonate cytidylyltransferase [Saprospirales bacterium]